MHIFNMDAHRDIVPLQCDLFSSRERAREGGGMGSDTSGHCSEIIMPSPVTMGSFSNYSCQRTDTTHTHTHTHTIRTHKHTYSVTADMMCLLEASGNKL